MSLGGIRGWLPPLLVCACLSTPAAAQGIDINEDQVGAWYMYFFDWAPKDRQWGVQGDTQYRSWNLGDDLQQILLRGALTYRPKSADVQFVAGYSYFTSGPFGESSRRIGENRTHLDINLPQRVGSRVFLRHRFRAEQRWIEGLDFRTRWRYAIFGNVPLNGDSMGKGAWYFSFFNEIFINGEKDIGRGLQVERFDRNWLYGAIGYSFTDNVRFQGGYLYEVTDFYNKGYLQFGFHQAF